MPTPVKKQRFTSLTLPRRAEQAISSFSNLSSWQYRLLSGSAAVAIQYKIESSNKNVDESTRKTSTVRTVLRLGLGTISGIITRFVAEKLGVRFINNYIREQEVYDGSNLGADKWLKLNIKEVSSYKNGYIISNTGDLLKKEQIKNSANYSIKKFDLKNLKLNKKILDSALVENIDFIKKLPKAFGNALALIATIVATISLEPFLTDKLLNFVMKKIKGGKKDESSK